MLNLLSIITFTPLVAALILALFLRGDDEAAQRTPNGWRWSRQLGDLRDLAVHPVSVRSRDTGFQFVEERDWILGLNYKMGVDGISVLFVMLTTFLMPITIAGLLERDSTGSRNT
jgi:NADH-quinone oxidoreductase subunit M